MVTETKPQIKTWPVANPVQEILIKARDLIADESHWTIRHRVDEYGRYCALGAIGSVRNSPLFGLNNGDPDLVQATKYLYDAVMETGFESSSLYWPEGWGVAEFNNTHRHEAVIKAFDRAIELA